MRRIYKLAIAAAAVATVAVSIYAFALDDDPNAKHKITIFR